jgi:hypothetical protein
MNVGWKFGYGIRKSAIGTAVVAKKVHTGFVATGNFTKARAHEAVNTANKFAPQSKGKIKGITGSIHFK